MYIRKNFRRSRYRQSPSAVADQASEDCADTRGDFARVRFWREHDLSVRAATALAAAGCQSLDEVRELGWTFFHCQENCGHRTLQELSDLVGGWTDAPRYYRAWVRRAPDEVLLAEMRRRGFAVGSDEA